MATGDFERQRVVTRLSLWEEDLAK